MATLVNCPSCQRKLKVPDELIGKKVKCPGCATIFEAGEIEETSSPEEEAPPRPRRREPAREEEDEFEEERPDRRRAPPPGDEYDEEEDDERPRRRRRRDEEDEEDDDRPRARRREEEEEYDEDYTPRRRKAGPGSLSSDYSIEIGTWFDYAKAHYSSVLGPMIGYILVYGAIVFAMQLLGIIPFVGILVALAGIVIHPPLQAGFVVVALAQLKGKRWSFGDFFSGFNWFGPLVLSNLLVGLAFLACVIPSIIVFVLAIVGSVAAKNPTFIILGIAFYVVNLFAALFVMARLSFFSVPLIIDRGYGPVEALQGSWNLGRGHMLGLVGVLLLFGLIMLGGYILCLVGALFTAPFVIMSHAAGYLLVAGTRPPSRRPSES